MALSRTGQALAVLALLLVAGCGTGETGSSGPSVAPSPAPASPRTSSTPTPTPAWTKAADPELRRELLAMLAADQEDRADPEAGVGGDQERTERLGQIVAEHG